LLDVWTKKTNSMTIEEDDHVEFDSYDQLSYLDTGDTEVELYVDGNFEGYIKVWKDSEMNGREYVCINHEIVYLDTLKKEVSHE
jgi:hypothetical protein